ncbi:hypothetical protein [Paenibacillus tundrae]|uniref:hypothetical protein n=1 Tax=Paenibacillus tundrae TaxID=528187 RepID=UPI0030CFC670
MMKRIHKPYLFFLLWNVLMVGGVHISTIQHEPGRGVSGNGNLGLLVLFPSILTFIILCMWTMTLTRRWFNDHRDRSDPMYALIPIVAILLCGLFIFMEVQFIHNLGEQLNGYTNDPDSAVYRFGWLNQYTNTLYYNFPILLFGLSFSIFIGWIMERILRNRS